MSVVNIYDKLPAQYSSKQKQYKNFESLPHMAFTGASGSGSSNVLMRTILQMYARAHNITKIKKSTPNKRT